MIRSYKKRSNPFISAKGSNSVDGGFFFLREKKIGATLLAKSVCGQNPNRIFSPSSELLEKRENKYLSVDLRCTIIRKRSRGGIVVGSSSK